MDISPIITALKSRCPSFSGRIAGAAEFAVLPKAAKLDMPAGYVIPMAEEVSDQESSNGYKQLVRERFAVIVVLSNTVDERGNSLITTVSNIRRELFAALLGWAPDEEHDRIVYEGYQLLDLDRARMYCEFEFSADMELREEDTYQHVFNDALPLLQEVGIQLDAIDPYDPNLVTIGPDGRIEVSADITNLDQ